MVEGAIRHGITMTVEGNYVDSHGQSEIGFGVTRLLNVDLLPRIKQINKVKLYRPAAGDPGACPRLAAALTRPIRWDLIDANYDQVIKYATAIKDGTATTEAVLSRFTRSATHPAYQAMLEIGRAQKTIFVARYLRDRGLQREIKEGLNVVEAWNGPNAVICYGRGGEISTNHRAFGLLSRGITVVPAFARDITAFEELVPDPQMMLPQDSYRGSRPRSCPTTSTTLSAQPCRCLPPTRWSSSWRWN
jgi:TnpA family transposase